MGMDYYACSATELSKDYVRTFQEFTQLESYVNGLGLDMEAVAYLLSYGEPMEFMEEEAIDETRRLWEVFMNKLTSFFPYADFYIEHVSDVEGADKPQEGWFIGINNYLIENPALQDLKNVANGVYWVQIG